MSLIISVIQKGSIIVDTNFLEEQVPAPHNNLFGFESCRKTLVEFRVRNALEMIKVVLKEKDKVGIAIW